MKTRPRIKIENTLFDSVLEMSGWFILFLVWIIPLLNYSGLPETIPTHFKLSGEADNFGSKLTIFLQPLIGTILFIGITILNRFPYVFNYPAEINEGNASFYYTLAIRLLRILKMTILILFMAITISSIRSAEGASNGLGIWFLPFTLILTIVPVFFYIIKMIKYEKKQ